MEGPLPFLVYLQAALRGCPALTGPAAHTYAGSVLIGLFTGRWLPSQRAVSRRGDLATAGALGRPPAGPSGPSAQARPAVMLRNAGRAAMRGAIVGYHCVPAASATFLFPPLPPALHAVSLGHVENRWQTHRGCPAFTGGAIVTCACGFYYSERVATLLRTARIKRLLGLQTTHHTSRNPFKS